MPPSRRECANAIRALSMDAVQKANSGHPGMPLGMADIAEVLWRDFLKFNPANPGWVNRDRFILSNGHGAMLQYALLHLTGFNLSMEDIKQFRQLHSRTPGHPEYGAAPGIETTTGPLGQGLANGVGMAIAEQNLAQTFNRNGHSIVDHYTYVFTGDGCLMEGISHEACSLAGTLGLGKLIVFWDDNGISIDGEVKDWFTEDVPKRFEAYQWHVVSHVDGHNPEAIREAIEAARQVTNKPSIICCKTHIAFGSPNLVDDAASHGAPLGEEEVALTRENLNWFYPPFEIPDEIYTAWDAREKGAVLEAKWNKNFAQYEREHSELAAEFLRRQRGALPKQWSQVTKQFITEVQTQAKDDATRKHSRHCLNAYAPMLPELIGGSGDLSGSNCTDWSGATLLSKKNRLGNYIEYGVREIAMSAMMNGMAAHGGMLPYAGTFLAFSDYARSAVRLSAMMQLHVIYVYSHDSIGLGEDGPTHQPIEHIASLRLIPGLNIWRPCDRVETAVAWQQVIEHSGPSCLLLTRQTVPHQVHDNNVITDIAKGGYVLLKTQATPDIIIIATGSEVSLAVSAAQQLQAEGVHAQVVSMPCCEVFNKQDAHYRESVLPSHVTKRLAIEAGTPDYWYQFVGIEGDVMGIKKFGASAPWKDVYKDYGFTVERVMAKVKRLLQSQHPSQKINSHK